MYCTSKWSIAYSQGATWNLIFMPVKKQHKKVSHQSDKKGQKNFNLSYTHIISKKGSQIQQKVYQKSVKKDECRYQNLSKIYKKNTKKWFSNRASTVMTSSSLGTVTGCGSIVIVWS